MLEIHVYQGLRDCTECQEIILSVEKGPLSYLSAIAKHYPRMCREGADWNPCIAKRAVESAPRVPLTY